jgi:predicted porin
MGRMMNVLKSTLMTGGVIFAMASAAHAADLPTTKGPPPAAAKTNCFETFWTWLDSTPANCPLSAYGITVYGQIDAGAGYSSHGVPFNPSYNNGVTELVGKLSKNALWQFVPNGLSQTNVGIKAREEFAPGWALVGNADLGFDPYSLRISDGAESLVENNNKTIGNQNTNSDSSRAGQWDNSYGYVGVSSSTFGTLTFGRHTTLSNDAVQNYDPMGGSYAFSLIGTSSTYVSGVGDTETSRYNTSAKYLVQYNNFRAGAVWQFGDYSWGNGSDGAYQFDVGADYAGFSFDAIYSYARDAVTLSTYSVNPLPAGVSQGDLKATLADVNGVVLAGKYVNGPLTLYSGYEYAVFSPPSDKYPGGFGSLGGYTVLPSGVNTTTYIDNKHLQIAWVGAKYAIRPDLDIAGAYYFAHQNDYAPPGSKPSVCGPNTVAAIPGASPQGSLNTYCAGDLQAVSALIDFRPVKRLDVYAGVMYSIASGGIASGYIHSTNIDPTIGLRLSF